MILSVQNNLDTLPETLNSYLSQNVSSGGTVVPLKNLSGLNIQWSQQIGKTGEEQTEIVNPLSLANGTALYNAGTTKFDHPLDTPVYQIHYDSIIFSRSTSGTAGTNSPIATVSITPDSLQTQYDDSSGVGTYAYKTQFYNSVSGDVSNESDWFIPSSDPTFYSLGKLRKRIKNTLYNSDYLPDDSVIDDWINEWVEEMTNAAIKVNKGYAIGTASYSFGTAGYGTITEGGFKLANKVEVTFDGSNYTPTSEISLNEYAHGDSFSGIYPRHSWEGNTVFRILPFGSQGTARFSFGKLSTSLVNEIDELPLPLRSYTTGCIEYGQYRALGLDQKEETANPHYSRFQAKKNDFIAEMTPRDQTGIKFIHFSEGLSGMNDDVANFSDWTL